MISTEVLEKLSYSEVRFIHYLCGKMGKPGCILRTPKENSRMTANFLKFIELGIIKVVGHDSNLIHFNFTSEYMDMVGKKILISFKSYYNGKW